MARIPLVDDDEAVRSAGIEVLSAFGHDVVTAEDGLEGAQRLKMQSFDLVITDKRMPRLDGMALIAATHRFQP